MNRNIIMMNALDASAWEQPLEELRGVERQLQQLRRRRGDAGNDRARRAAWEGLRGIAVPGARDGDGATRTYVCLVRIFRELSRDRVLSGAPRPGSSVELSRSLAAAERDVRLAAPGAGGFQSVQLLVSEVDGGELEAAEAARRRRQPLLRQPQEQTQPPAAQTELRPLDMAAAGPALAPALHEIPRLKLSEHLLAHDANTARTRSSRR